MVIFWHTLSGDSRRFGSRGYKAGDKRPKGFPFGRCGGGRRMRAVRRTSPPSTPPSGEPATARKLRGKRKNERSRGTAAWCAVAAAVDRFFAAARIVLRCQKLGPIS